MRTEHRVQKKQCTGIISAIQDLVLCEEWEPPSHKLMKQ